MNGFNKVILAGNLTRDPELRFTPGGTAICKFGLAVNRKYTQNGEKKEEVTFLDVDAFGKQAETIAQYLKKGRPILLEGRLKLDQWDDKQSGQKRSKLGVVLESFTFLDSGERNEPASNRGIDKSDVPPSSPVPGATADPDDDVPFTLPPRPLNHMRLA